jgi:hypothetical protein
MALVAAGAAAQDEEAQVEKAQSKARLELMGQTIAGFEVSSEATAASADLEFAPQPLLRYSDPTRGITDETVLLDASVWRLGKAGRPKALVTLEIYRSGDEKAVLSYEFASLTDAKVTLRHKEHKTAVWEATSSALTMQPLASAPAPAATAAGRLTQMRQMARRFKVREKLGGGEVIECRLLAQPIDRYQPSGAKLADGAIFAFANGTNPEVGIVLESDGSRWSYGPVRLSAAESTLELDGKDILTFPIGDFIKLKGPYSASNHPLTLP